MANNKLVDKEVLKKVREKLQQKIEDGIIVAGQALTSKAINPVSEESGTIQETPFINQGTGTANNTTVVDTSPVGKQLEKQGNTIVYNQLVNISSLVSSWLNINKQHFVFQPHSGGYQANIQEFANPIPAGHKILLLLDKHSGSISGTSKIGGYTAATYAYQGYLSLDVPNGISAVSYTATADVTHIRLALEDNTIISEEYDAYVYYIDLTQWFNGKIPSDLSSNPDHFTWYYNGDLSYNVGEFRNCAGRYLECGQGRNVYNPAETYNRVIPNVEYYYYGGSATTITYYDKDQNAISTASVSSGSTFTTPSNCIYINSSVTNNITISEYYTNGEDYDAYYPYVAPVIYDTGTEVLRRIRVPDGDDIVDTKAPDETITANIGTVDMGTLDWNEAGNDETYVRAYVGISDMKELANSMVAGKGLYSVNYPIGIGDSPYGVSTKTYLNYVYVNLKISDIGWDGDSSTFRATVKAYLSGVTLYYELATPTTEQGTAFSENIQIHDYSYMAWKNTDNEYVDIPQGTKLFYPADYVLFTDTLYSYTNGDVGNIVLKGELDVNDPDTLKGSINLTNSLYAIIQENIAGALRHQLAVKASIDFANTNYIDLGNLDWTYSSTYHRFKANVPSDCKFATNNNTSANALCSIYGTCPASSSLASDKCVAIGENASTGLFVYDTGYTNATVFKVAMKGILLAYEKA